MIQFTLRQKEIINAAIQLIAVKGIQEVTIKNLSNKIGTAESAIYRHFKSKQEILLGILGQFKTNKTLALEHIQSSDVSELEQLEMVFSERFKQFIKNPAITSVIFSEEIFQNDKQLANEVYAIMESSQKTILSIIKKGQSNRVIRDDISASQLSLMVIGSLRLIVAKWRLSGFAFNLQKEGNDLWKSLRKIIKK